MFDKFICISLIPFLLLLMLVVEFFRWRVWRKLIIDYVRLTGAPTILGNFDVFLMPWRIVIRNYKVILWIRKSLHEVPDPVRRRYGSFKLLTCIDLILFVLIIIIPFGLGSFSMALCGV
jgi:hypothetical protein